MTDKIFDHHTGDAIPGEPVRDIGPNVTPGITTETAAPQSAQNKWTADHIGNIPTPPDPDALIPPTPRADPVGDREMAVDKAQPTRAEDVNKRDVDKQVANEPLKGA